MVVLYFCQISENLFKSATAALCILKFLVSQLGYYGLRNLNAI
jgi:hypothetical protein